MEPAPREILCLPLDDGTSIYVEASLLDGYLIAGAEGETEVAAVAPNLESLLDSLVAFSSRIAKSFATTNATSAAVEFGCEVGIESGRLVALIGKASGKTTFKVRLEWANPQSQ